MAAHELVTDELDLMRRLLPLAGAHLIELGCGKAEIARRLIDDALVASITALEVDRTQLARNAADPSLARIKFVPAGAEAIPAAAASFDIAMMLKSLHHVPLDLLDTALDEIGRVLRAGGILYVSEPVYAGEFNEVMRVFHDEGVQRAAAYQALWRSVERGRFEMAEERIFDAPISFRDFDDFVNRIVRVTHSDLSLEGEVLHETRRRFERHMAPGGARFIRPMRVNLLLKKD